MLTIRSARAADAAVIAEHNRLLAWESESKRLDPAVAFSGVVAAIADPEHKGRYYLACRGETIVGQCQVTLEWSDWRDGWYWWLQSVYVAAEHRGQGVFRALYEKVRRDARAAGNVIALRLYVERDNRSAQATYEKLGMKREHYDMMSESLV